MHTGMVIDGKTAEMSVCLCALLFDSSMNLLSCKTTRVVFIRLSLGKGESYFESYSKPVRDRIP